MPRSHESLATLLAAASLVAAGTAWAVFELTMAADGSVLIAPTVGLALIALAAARLRHTRAVRAVAAFLAWAYGLFLGSMAVFAVPAALLIVVSAALSPQYRGTNSAP